MAKAQEGRWVEIRERVVSTPELQERYERTKHAVASTRQLLQQIDAERERSGLSKAELARRMGTSPSVVRRVFSSESSNPTLRTVLEMLVALGVDVELRFTRAVVEERSPARKRRGSAPREGTL